MTKVPGVFWRRVGAKVRVSIFGDFPLKYLRDSNGFWIAGILIGVL
jgi:hypothetical protein